HHAGRGRERHGVPVQPAGLRDLGARLVRRLRLQRDGRVGTNPKSEARNPKQIRIPKQAMTKTTASRFRSLLFLPDSDLFRISSFGFRIWSVRDRSAGAVQ